MKEAHRLLAIIYSSKGEKKKAASELEIYLKLYPKAPDAEKLRTTIRELKEASDPKPVQ
jgi:regulator of sirC expression with transglutaminase-like and TPR domain